VLCCVMLCCAVLQAVLEYRLTRGPEKWRNVYKALLVRGGVVEKVGEWRRKGGRGKEGGR